MGYLGFLLVGVIHGGQFGSIVTLGLADCTVQRLADLQSYGDGRVFTHGTYISTVFRQQILLDIVERQRNVVLAEQSVQVAEIVGGLIIPAGCYQIVISIEPPFA